MALDRSSTPHHRVLRARFEIEGSSEASLLRLREQIVTLGDTALPAALEAAFDGLAGADEVISIARLHVDLGEVDADTLDLSRLTEATRAALMEQIGKHVHKGATTARDALATSRSQGGDQADTPKVTRISTRHHATLAVATYLETGQLPAEAAHLTLTDLYELLIPAPVAAAHLIARIRDIAARSHRIAALIRLFATAPAALADAMIAAAAAATTRPIRSSIPDTARRAAHTAASLERIATETAEMLFASDQSDAAPADSDLPTGETVEDPETSTKPQPVENAGVVLLAPYFTRLFSLCDLARDGKFTSDAARATAARLLHYLATAEVRTDEPVLAIPRLLCAVPPAQPVLSLTPLEAHLTERADALLSAAIGHWSKLGNTSPAGLRETFLMRSGVIRQAGDRITIAVEQSGLDVLLDSLPWSISTIALPWLPGPIRVDWR